MASQPQAITRPTVIIGVDGSEDSRRALHWAAAHAGRRRQQLRVRHVVDLPQSQLRTNLNSQPADLVAARELVGAAVADVERTWPEVLVSGEWLVGTPWAVLVRSTNPTDLVVVGSRGLGRVGPIAIGSVSNEVAQRATCPVVVVRWSRLVGYTHARRGVVVGVDGSGPATEAVGFAFAAAAERQLPLTVVHALWDERLDIAETIVGWREKYPDVAVVTRYEYGPPAQVLADLSAGADLVVIGSHGRTATTALLLGSVSRYVLERADCAVAIVRGQAQRRSLDRRQATHCENR